MKILGLTTQSGEFCFTIPVPELIKFCTDLVRNGHRFPKSSGLALLERHPFEQLIEGVWRKGKLEWWAPKEFRYDIGFYIRRYRGASPLPRVVEGSYFDAVTAIECAIATGDPEYRRVIPSTGVEAAKQRSVVHGPPVLIRATGESSFSSAL